MDFLKNLNTSTACDCTCNLDWLAEFILFGPTHKFLTKYTHSELSNMVYRGNS